MPRGQVRRSDREVYSDNIVSIEAFAMEGMPARQEGIEAIKGKNQWWVENHDIHGVEVEGPLVGGDKFAVTFAIDATFKPSAQRMAMDEMALYTVTDGKIVQEEFFYEPGPEMDA